MYKWEFTTDEENQGYYQKLVNMNLPEVLSLEEAAERLNELEREVGILRIYMDRDSKAMADERLAEISKSGELIDMLKPQDIIKEFEENKHEVGSPAYVRGSDHLRALQQANAKIQELWQSTEPQSVESVSLKRLRDKITELEQQLKKAESVIEFYGDGFRLCQLICDNVSFSDNSITLKDENITERARQYLKSRGE